MEGELQKRGIIEVWAKQIVVVSFVCLFGCAGPWLLHTDFLQLWRAGATLCHGVRVSLSCGFSCCRAQALGVWVQQQCGSVAWAQLLCGMWNPPQPGIESVSSALAGGFLITGPLGKSLQLVFKSILFFCWLLPYITMQLSFS